MSTHANIENALNLLPLGCRQFMQDYAHLHDVATGSYAGKHQGYAGGYLDHLDEVLGLAGILYVTLDHQRALPFTLRDAYLVLFMHDIEKVFLNVDTDSRRLDDQRYFNAAVLNPAHLKHIVGEEYDLKLSETETIALKYVHGENEDYSPHVRVTNELGAFVHCCDYLSARLWHDEPKKSGRFNAFSVSS